MCARDREPLSERTRVPPRFMSARSCSSVALGGAPQTVAARRGVRTPSVSLEPGASRNPASPSAMRAEHSDNGENSTNSVSANRMDGGTVSDFLTSVSPGMTEKLTLPLTRPAARGRTSLHLSVALSYFKRFIT